MLPRRQLILPPIAGRIISGLDRNREAHDGASRQVSNEAPARGESNASAAARHHCDRLMSEPGAHREVEARLAAVRERDSATVLRDRAGKFHKVSATADSQAVDQ